MSPIVIYTIKLSISLSVIYVFYRVVLRRLTFYNLNRFYLICYTAVSFFIPFINVTPTLEKNELMNNGIIRFIPSVGALNTIPSPKEISGTSAVSHWGLGEGLLIIFLAGVFVMLIRLAIQFISFARMVGKAQLISDTGIRLYQVNQDIIPFSFGNAIFVNNGLHTNGELEEIVSHEFVHVRQKHTLDIIWAEFLCILCWYNPFVWMIRKAIRQNLEFIADNKVLQSGIDKKQYQYLLLKVIGNNHFSIAPKFNFSSLKKRIAMMNKIKSARVHLVKFLFGLPLIIILLLSFRDKLVSDTNSLFATGIVYDLTNGAPMEGVIVIDKSNGSKAITDRNGYYSIQLSWKKKTTLVTSLIFKKKEYSSQDASITFNDITAPKTYIILIGMKNGISAVSDCPHCYVKYLPVNDRIVNYEKVKNTFDGYLKFLMDNEETVEDITRSDKVFSELVTGRNLTNQEMLKISDYIEVYKRFLKKNNAVKDIGWVYDNVDSNKVTEIHIIKKSGDNEVYHLNNPAVMSEFETKYGADYKLLIMNLLPPVKTSGIKETSGSLRDKEMSSAPAQKINNNISEEAATNLSAGSAVSSEKISIRPAPDSILCFMDGEEVKYSDIEKLDGNTIESMNVLRPVDSVLKIYGPRAKYGVILIKSRLTALRSDARHFFGGIDAGTADPVADTIIFRADTIRWSADEKKIYFKGHANLTQAQQNFESASIELHVSKAYVLLNGKEFSPDVAYINTQHTIYQLVNLDKRQAMRKYGEKGVDGAIEITSRN